MAWVREHETELLAVLVTAGVTLRILLAVWAPTPYGYVFDFYHEAIQKAYALGHLPASTACWQCYHPPLFTLIGLPLYALGKRLLDGASGLADPALRFVTPLALVAGAVTTYFSYRILRFFRFRGAELVAGTGLILVFPCLFISSYGIEADILLTALMTAFFYYLLKFPYANNRTRIPDWIRLGIVAGLACATKYTGLLAPVILSVTALLAVSSFHPRRRLLARATIAVVICAAIGAWKYVDNIKQYGKPLFANGSAQQGFAVSGRPSLWRQYEFNALRMGALIDLARGRLPPGDLTNLPFYRSVWTTLHGMAWGDMSFFSDPSRHGFYRKPYPRKPIQPALASTVLILGLVPNALAVAGFFVTVHRRVLWPLAVGTVITWAAYIAWFVAQESWALKTKYVLFLLPAYTVYALLGVRWLERLWPPAAQLAWLLLAALIVTGHMYLLNFVWS